MKLHIAKDGDSIDALSEKYGISPERILEANPQLGDGTALTRGVKVKIPTGPTTVQAEAAAPAQPIAPVAAENPTAGVTAAATANPTADAAVNPTVSAAANPTITFQAAGASPHSSYIPTPPPKLPESVAAMSANPSFAAPLPTPFGATAAENAQTLPAYYKTDLPAASSHSPLHVPWSGLGDDVAVHPFAPLPTPVVPAGAPTYYPGPYGFGAPPATYPGTTDPSAYATYGALPATYPGMTDPSAYATYGALPPFPPAIPQSYPGYSTHAAPDCGCGGGGMPRLPYALPLRTAAAEDRAYASGTPAPASAQTAEVPTAAAEPSEKTAHKKSRAGKKTVRIASRDDALRSFLKRARGAGKPGRRKSRPWVND